MQEKIKSLILEAIKNLGINEDVSFAIEHPEDLKNGDYSTNVAMVLSKRLEKNPRELAEEIVEFLRSDLKNSKRSDLGKLIQGVEIAGPGFINFYLSREFFTNSVKETLKKGDDWGKNSILTGKKIMVEYTDPNPFKPFHIGHLMTNAIGESISRVVEFSGAKVVRANYQGDVGPHVAKAIYIILHSKEYKEVGLPNMLGSNSEKAMWVGKCYSEGSNLYDTDENVKKEIDEINRKIYDKSDKDINDIYAWGRAITLDAFEEIYKILGTKFDKYFFESKMAPVGEKIVRANVGKIFEESNGAIIFPAEKYDPKLHTRVFINSQGLPTYETKEIGLTTEKFKKGIFEKSLDLSIVITATEQADYMKVVQKAIALLHPELEKKMKHITHGMMRFTDGKMSSRKGNVVTGESLLRDSMDVVHEKIMDREFNNNEKEDIARIVGVSALKYSILKSSLGSDIFYDFEKSISFDGDSGPYLQYTAVRANSILEKSKSFDLGNKNDKSSIAGSPLGDGTPGKPDVSEEAFRETPEHVTDLEKKIYQFGEFVEYSYKEFAPHHIAIYLTELASSFNTFYSNTQILKEDNLYMAYHLDLVMAFYQTMKNGLWLLGIEVPERM